MRHQKKLEEFFKGIKDTNNEADIRTKFKDTLIRSNCLKEDDIMLQLYIQVINHLTA